MRVRRVGLIALAAAALTPVDGASAATAEVECEGTRGCSIYFVAYRAGPGEANRVTVTQLEGFRARLRDDGALVAAGEGCERIDPHEVVCGEVTTVRAALGDGDDELAVIALQSAMSAFVDGGTGDDRIEAGGTLVGGGGRDILVGGSASDTLIDGDSVRAPDADVMDGGAGVDTVSYSGRRRPVFVDLARGGRGGERGEGDVLRGLEGVTGGAGDDRLAGRTPEVRRRGLGPTLRGEKGDDVIVGTAADDHIMPGPGADRVDGRGGNDLFGLSDVPGRSAPDAIRCGSGTDVIEGAEDPDFVAATCERPDYFGPFLGVWLHGAVRGGRPVLGTTAECIHSRGCRYDVRVLARRSGRPGAPQAGTVLARRRLALRRRGLRIALRLTPAARLALRRAGRLPVLVEVRWAVPTGRDRAAFRTELRLPD